MSWKSSSDGVSLKRKRWAMTTLLTFYYSGSVLLLLITASVFLYVGLVRNMLQQDQSFLEHKMEVLTALLQTNPLDRAGLDQEVLEEAEISSRSPSPFMLRVLDQNARIVVETPGMAKTLPAARFSSGAARAANKVFWRPRGGEHFLRSSTTVTQGAGAHLWHIQAALNVDAQLGLLATYRRDIALVLVTGLLIAALIGGGITRKGLRPITQIGLAVERITVDRLEDRIQAGPWPQELLGLASAFDQMLDRLQTSFDRLSQFSADLAHELRTPINNLMGEAQVALSRPRSSLDYVRVLQSALEEYGRLARMIDTMLFLAQAESSRMPVEFVQLDAATEMHAVADFYQAVADEEGITLSCQGEASVVADPLLLRRALSNLLSNALKYTSRGGSVTMQAESRDDRVILRVIDSGSGIAPEHLPKLADRFYRVDPARSATPGGFGLGLAIVKSIMDLHRGELAIRSARDKGTEAALILPAQRNAQRQSA